MIELKYELSEVHHKVYAWHMVQVQSLINQNTQNQITHHVNLYTYISTTTLW